MRNVKNLAVGDVITSEKMSNHDEYFLVVDTDEVAGETSLVSLGENRFRDVVLGRQKRIVIENVEDQLGKVRRHARHVKRVTFSRH